MSKSVSMRYHLLDHSQSCDLTLCRQDILSMSDSIKDTVSHCQWPWHKSTSLMHKRTQPGYLVQSLLRNVIPGSFPNQLTDKPMPGLGQRRFIIIDENIYNLHGERIEKVRSLLNSHNQTSVITFSKKSCEKSMLIFFSEDYHICFNSSILDICSTFRSHFGKSVLVSCVFQYCFSILPTMVNFPLVRHHLQYDWWD